MDIPNNAWVLVGLSAPKSLTIQNVGTSRIAYVFAATLPGAEDIVLDSSEHFLLNPDHPVVTFLDLNTDGLSLFARSLGPVSGKLAVSAVAA